MKKCGYVAIVGDPNVGKSTLLNSFLNFNLSIINKKAQTTRNKILGALTENHYQIIFIDTPGIIKPKYELQSFMLSSVKSSIKEADVIVYLFDVINYKSINEIELEKDKKYIFALNKIDLINKEELEKIVDFFSKEKPNEVLIPISAINKTNLDELKNKIVEFLPESEFLYEEDFLTDRPEKFFVAEIIRNCILDLYEQEIPYSVFVEIPLFKERVEGKDYIEAEIIVERESQKVIIIGKEGSKLKQLGEVARLAIENFLGRPVFLKLFVKVRKNWRKNKEFLKKHYT
ncbi:MAG: GTPase Era [Ignavibacteria bacterium]|nr:GTPase Era [Ignavibacteria bacterium]